MSALFVIWNVSRTPATPKVDFNSAFGVTESECDEVELRFGRNDIYHEIVKLKNKSIDTIVLVLHDSSTLVPIDILMRVL